MPITLVLLTRSACAREKVIICYICMAIYDNTLCRKFTVRMTYQGIQIACRSLELHTVVAT